MTTPPYPGDSGEPDPSGAGASDPTRPIGNDERGYPPPPGQDHYSQQGPPQGPQGQGYPPQGPPQGFPPGGYGPAYGANPQAPYGYQPTTGLPYSDKSKLVAGLLQVLLPLGIGRFYIGNTGTGVAQLLVTIFTCGIGAIWPFVDGIIILVGNPRDSDGRPLRDSV